MCVECSGTGVPLVGIESRRSSQTQLDPYHNNDNINSNTVVLHGYGGGPVSASAQTTTTTTTMTNTSSSTTPHIRPKNSLNEIRSGRTRTGSVSGNAANTVHTTPSLQPRRLGATGTTPAPPATVNRPRR